MISADQFAEVFARSTRALWSIAAAVLCDPTLADDVLQEAALIGLKRRARLEDPVGFPRWMGRIVRQVALRPPNPGKLDPALIS